MTLMLEIDPLPVLRAIRAAADVIEVEEGHGFCASVCLFPGQIAVARLDRSLRGAPHEGAVLRWVMEHTTGLFGPGLFVYQIEGKSTPTLTSLSPSTATDDGHMSYGSRTDRVRGPWA